MSLVPATWWGFEPSEGTSPSLTAGAAVAVDPGFVTADLGLGTVDVDFGSAPAATPALLVSQCLASA